MLSSNKIKFILIIINTVIISISGSYGQSGYYNQAENLFKNKNYYEATQVFEKYLSTEKNSRPRSTPFAIEKKQKGKANLDPHQEAVYKLATSYRMINDYNKAEKYYHEAVGFSGKSYPDVRYWYAVTLRANKKYPEALAQLTTFLETYTQMDDLLMGADREMEDLKFNQLQSERTNDLFTLSEVKGKDPAAGYALSQRADGFVFTAVSEKTEKDGQKWYLNSLYESMNADNPLENADPVHIDAKNGTHDGMATFTRDGKTMFFTRWTKNNNQTKSEIFISRWRNKSWTKPVKAQDPLNIEGYNSGQPSLTSDNRYLLFSSDRPGGSGGYDLWASSLDSLQDPIQVRNLGNVINTSGDEEAPFMHNKSRTLVFSTNGRTGMGGFDIFYAQGNFSMTSWDKPTNAGAPLNSSKDDLYYISTDEDNLWNTGWISSDRSSECCLALFSVKGNNAQYVNGYVLDCKTRKPLVNAALTVSDLRHPDRLLGKFKSDSAGHYSFELHNTAHFKISATQKDYEPSSLDFNLQNIQGRDSLIGSLCMNAIVYPEKEVDELLKALERSSHVGNFAYKKAVLSDSAHENLDSLARILKKFPALVIEIDGYTDGIGGVAYNIKLSQKRVDACINYLLAQGVSKTQLEGRAMGKCCPIAPDQIDGKDNPAGREKNRRVEYKVLKH